MKIIEKYKFKGYFNRKAWCHLIVDDDASVVVATERADNPGTSITNGVEALANQVCQEFSIDPQKLIWIERYTQNSYENLSPDEKQQYPDYALVTFNFKKGQLFSGKHQHIKDKDLPVNPSNYPEPN
ncbi:MAG: hypothetical protein AAF694_04255 [Bacteroidota bacterium]